MILLMKYRSNFASLYGEILFSGEVGWLQSTVLQDDWHEFWFLFVLQVGCILRARSVSFAKIIGKTSPESSSPRLFQRNVSACFACMVCTTFVCACVCLSVVDWGSADCQSLTLTCLHADCTQISWVQMAVAIAILILGLCRRTGV